jgi:spore maturation protein CgeB
MVCDFAFVGTGYASRIAFFEAMDLAGLDVVLAGNWQQLHPRSPLHAHVAHDLRRCLDNTDTAQLYRSAKVGLNLYRRESNDPDLSEGWSIGPREVEMAACGHCFVRDPRGETDEVLGMLPAFDSPDEAAEQLRWLLPTTTSARRSPVRPARRSPTGHSPTTPRVLLRLLDKE